MTASPSACLSMRLNSLFSDWMFITWSSAARTAQGAATAAAKTAAAKRSVFRSLNG